MIGQTRIMSLVESSVNIGIGYFVALATQITVFPLFAIHISLADNLMIGAVFTVVAIVRSYCVRRLFNWWHIRRVAA